MLSSLVRALASVRGLRIGWHVSAGVSGQPLLLLALLLRLGGHALVLGLYHLTRLCKSKMTGQSTSGGVIVIRGPFNQSMAKDASGNGIELS